MNHPGFAPVPCALWCESDPHWLLYTLLQLRGDPDTSPLAPAYEHPVTANCTERTQVTPCDDAQGA